MDREAAVIRAEMTQTRAELDRKITRLEDRARELRPRALWERNKPDYLLDRVIGGALTLVGTGMMLGHLRRRRDHRARVRTALAAYGHW
jgi:hypothetical protein